MMNRRGKKESINVIIANIDYEANFGDIAMLKVGVSRILEKHPLAKIYIFTESPEKLKATCPEVIPFSPRQRQKWFNTRVFPIPLRIVPKLWRKRIFSIEKLIRLNYPKWANRLMLLRSKLKVNPPVLPDDFFSIINNSDFVISSGGGFINSIFLNNKQDFINTFIIAQKLGKKTAMFGQGIGPLEKKDLIDGTIKVFSNLNVLGIREGLTSPKYVDLLCIPIEKVVVTGDDAIEIAMNCERKFVERNCLGVNIRRAYYSGSFEALLPDISIALKEFSDTNKVSVIPIPISLAKPQSDLESIKEFLQIDEAEYQLAQGITTIEALIHQIDRCRIVITGSYHAGVFALARGIPVVALVGSKYYDEKFCGLAGQFGEGCQIIRYDSKKLINDFKKAVELGIQSRERLEMMLINRALEQIKLSRSTWDQFLGQISL